MLIAAPPGIGFFRLYTSRHRESNLAPQEQTTDKKLLQNVKDRMKQSGKEDYCMKIFGKIN